MIEYNIENGIYVVHLRVDHWSADTRRALFEEAKQKAAEHNWPTVYCQVSADKKRFMEHLGMKFFKKAWVTKGIQYIYCFNTEVFKC